MRLTKARRKNLQWIADEEPVGWFDASGPTTRQVKNFAKDGLVEVVPDSRPFHLIRYRITPAGRQALDRSND